VADSTALATASTLADSATVSNMNDSAQARVPRSEPLTSVVAAGAPVAPVGKLEEDVEFEGGNMRRRKVRIVYV
jgi:hypothetical protein